MVKRTGPTNIVTRITVRELKKMSTKTSKRIWSDVADRILRPSRRRVIVNISRINRYSKSGEIIVVPGKVLGAGTINHPVTVAALDFSARAREKIERASGRCIHILDLLEENPPPSKIKIME